jgi:hypothetical protein
MTSKKPTVTEIALNIIPPLLEIQLELADPSKRNTASLIYDNYALGYIFGYHDGILKALKVENQTTHLAILGVSYDTIFHGMNNAAPLLRRSLDIQQDETFRKGMMNGGREAIAFLRDKKTPLGLSEWLSQ